MMLIWSVGSFRVRINGEVIGDCPRGSRPVSACRLRCLPSHSPAEAPMQIDEHGGYRQDFDEMGF